MNTNPNAIKILCFGDSNTWGRMPDRSGRYAANIRWPGQLQDMLGNEYYVIEEGLGGRTTDLDDRGSSVRNGKTYLLPCLESHNPVDIVIIMLGTNDLKIRFERNPEDIAQALQGLVDMAKETAKDKNENSAKIILVSPIHADPNAPRFMEFYENDYSPESGPASKLLAKAIKSIADHMGCDFVDASEVAKVGEDGLHLDLESNSRLARKIADTITSDR